MRTTKFVNVLILLLTVFIPEACKYKNENRKAAVKPATIKENNVGPKEIVLIHQAALDGQLSQVTRLLTEGIDVDLKDTEGRTPLMYASFNGHKEIIKLLIEKGANVNLGDRYGRTALMMASSGPYMESVKILLDNYADPNIRDKEEHFTALMYAASDGQLEVVKLLLANKADFSLKDIDGDDAITFAGKNGHKGVVNFLQSYKK
jgi:ankyrin repeat protein